MTQHASYIYDIYSFIRSFSKDELVKFGNLESDGNPIPSFDEDLLVSLCDDVTKILEKEENVIEVDGDTIIVGDIHGSFHDLLRIFQYIEASKSKVIFLGDYVDRGSFSLECMTLLFALKILKPTTFYLLRGNHEFDAMCSYYGFKNEILNHHNPRKPIHSYKDLPNNKIIDECSDIFDDVQKNQIQQNEDVYFANHININCYKYSEKLYESFMRAFSFLPIGAIVNSTTFCIHGGLTPLLDRVENMQSQIQRPITEFDQNILVSDIVWGDPAPRQSQNYSDNHRGRGHLFNGPVVVNFLKNNGLKRLVRGHECVRNGVEFLFNDKCITVFSASSYCSEMGNSSGILKIYKENDRVEPVIFPPIYRLKKCDANYYRVQSFVPTEVTCKLRNNINKKDLLLSFKHIRGSQSEHGFVYQFHTSRSSSSRKASNEDCTENETNLDISERRKSNLCCLLPPLISGSRRKSHILSPQISLH